MTDTQGPADKDFVAADPNYNQSLPVFDLDDDTGPAPTPAPDGSVWEPADSSSTWEDDLVVDPAAAAEATRERMREQFEQEHGGSNPA
jgi:hypothetical protein